LTLTPRPPASVLRIGPVTDSSLADALGWPMHEADTIGGAETAHDDFVGAQLGRRFDVIAVDASWLGDAGPGRQRAFLHSCAQHLLPRGLLVAYLSDSISGHAWSIADHHALCGECDLVAVDTRADDPGASVVIHRRSARFNVHDLVDEARSLISRVSPAELAARLGSSTPPVVVDTRTDTDRARFGTIEHSVHVPRTVLEWHLDPANGYCHSAVRSFDQAIIVVCNGGYSSSVAAANLIRIGFTDVADLIGGVAAWRAAGLALVPPTHSHLDC
jgi:rhodanese-related sulfurtransferase